MKNTTYVHGYSGREALRLNDQANTLDEIIHNDSVFQEGSLVLEAGCGVGAQTKIIAPKNPGANFLSVDISADSIQEAVKMAQELKIENVEFKQADIFNLSYADNTFDAVIVCFVLEHLTNPLKALNELKRVLRTGGIIMIIEGDHGSTFFHPDSVEAHSAIQCQVILQAKNGGNANIGRELYPLLKACDFCDIEVTPRVVYVDDSKPQLVDGFIKNTFTAMIEGVRENALSTGLINAEKFDKGITDLYRTAEKDGVFSYRFFKRFLTKK